MKATDGSDGDDGDVPVPGYPAHVRWIAGDYGDPVGGCQLDGRPDVRIGHSDLRGMPDAGSSVGVGSVEWYVCYPQAVEECPCRGVAVPILPRRGSRSVPLR